MGSCGRAHALLESIQKHIGGTLRISWRGVPYLLLDGPDRFSISYFGRANKGSLAVVVEAGSALAHIVTVAQEKNAGGVGDINIVHLPKASGILKEGTHVTVDAMNRCIDVKEALV